MRSASLRRVRAVGGDKFCRVGGGGGRVFVVNDPSWWRFLVVVRCCFWNSQGRCSTCLSRVVSLSLQLPDLQIQTLLPPLPLLVALFHQCSPTVRSGQLAPDREQFQLSALDNGGLCTNRDTLLVSSLARALITHATLEQAFS